jgi:hypothetical protein
MRAMNRVTSYINFAVWFVGLAYAALWPLAAEQPTLSIGVHVVGAASGLWVAICLIGFGVRRLMRGVRFDLKGRFSLRQSIKAMRRAEPTPPARRWVPPRREFGLRRAPR